MGERHAIIGGHEDPGADKATPALSARTLEYNFQ